MTHLSKFFNTKLNLAKSLDECMHTQKATMNTLVFLCMCNVSKQATHHIMTVTSIHLCPCDVVVNGFTKFSSICNPPPQWPVQVNLALIFKLTYKTYSNIGNGLFTHGG